MAAVLAARNCLSAASVAAYPSPSQTPSLYCSIYNAGNKLYFTSRAIAGVLISLRGLRRLGCGNTVDFYWCGFLVRFWAGLPTILTQVYLFFFSFFLFTIIVPFHPTLYNLYSLMASLNSNLPVAEIM